jgi:hypothetical protein
MIEFIDCLYTPFRTTHNYSSIVALHTLQFTVTHIRVLSLHLSYPCNGFQHSNYTSLTVTAAHMKSSLNSLISFLLFLIDYLRLPSQETPSILFCRTWILVIEHRGGSNRKHIFYRYSPVMHPLLLTYLFPRDPVYRDVASLRYSCFQTSCHTIIDCEKL